MAWLVRLIRHGLILILRLIGLLCLILIGLVGRVGGFRFLFLFRAIDLLEDFTDKRCGVAAPMDVVITGFSLIDGSKSILGVLGGNEPRKPCGGTLLVLRPPLGRSCLPRDGCSLDLG